MKLSIFCPFGSKTPIHAQKIGVLGISPPKWGKGDINEIPKRHALVRVLLLSVISTGSAVFAGTIGVPNTRTDKDHAECDICSNRPRLRERRRPGNHCSSHLQL